VSAGATKAMAACSGGAVPAQRCATSAPIATTHKAQHHKPKRCGLAIVKMSVARHPLIIAECSKSGEFEYQPIKHYYFSSCLCIISLG
jgi:hypothetical protein